MKGRAVKLREAHKAGWAPAFCSVAWSPGGQHVVTASAADVAILIHDAAAVSAAGTGARGSGSAAASAAGTGARGSGSAAAVATIRLHKDGVTAVALAPGSGGSLASGSIDHSVNFYSFPDGTFQSNVARFTLPIRSLAFNKKGALLAAAGDDDGIVDCYSRQHDLQGAQSHKGSVTGWLLTPKNDYLASIDSFGTVIFWDLCLGSEARSLSCVAPTFGSDHSVKNTLCWSPDGHTLAVPGLRNNVQPICSLCWSPNGRYLATAGPDRQVLVWDEVKAGHQRQKFDERILLIDVMGKFGIWESVVLLTMKSPIEGAPELNPPRVPLFDDEDEEEKPSTSAGFDDEVDESLGDSAPFNHKRNFRRLVTARMQAAFQSGSTPSHPGKRNFLRPQSPSMTDYFGFTMAALNESGSVFANPCKGDNNMSTLMYRPFSSWAGNSEWSMRFEGEEVKSVTLGAGWVAAVTSLNLLRIFTEGGLQMHILSVSGPVVTVAGHGDQGHNHTPSGRLVLTPSSHLAWFGFSENGQLAGILRVFFFLVSFGGSWLQTVIQPTTRKSEDKKATGWVDPKENSRRNCCSGLDTAAFEDEAFNTRGSTELAKVTDVGEINEGSIEHFVTRLKLPILQEKYQKKTDTSEGKAKEGEDGTAGVSTAGTEILKRRGIDQGWWKKIRAAVKTAVEEEPQWASHLTHSAKSSNPAKNSHHQLLDSIKR
ncbi:hypothetical protein ZWY2020_011423 [Hordeum vulgare]|nr:hypothetical protein ZWY2020_011423 [Hordeum vulgare]